MIRFMTLPGNADQTPRLKHANRLPVLWLSLLLSLCPGWLKAEVTPEQPMPEHVVLQLKWFHQFQFAGYYAAKEKGYYSEEGLEVEIRGRILGKEVVNQVVSGEADYGIGDSGIIADYANGEPIVALAAIFQHNPLIFISKQSSGINSPYEMVGKRIMFDANPDGDELCLRALLDEVGLKPDQYSAVPLSFNNDDLIEGKVDVMSAYLTDQPFYFNRKGIRLNLINPQNYGLDFYGDLLFTRRSELTDHPGRAERFRRATLKGWQYALSHPEELATVVKNQYRSKLSLEHLLFEAAEIRKLIVPDTTPLGQIEPSRLRREAAFYSHLGRARPMDESQLDKFIYDAPVDLQLTDQERTWLRLHPVIRLGIDRDFAPYEWIDASGDYVGMVADFMSRIEQRLGLNFSIIKDISWHETLAMAEAGELDMIGAAVKTNDRERFLSFTAPYVTNPTIIINDDRHGYAGDLAHLAGKRIAVEKGYFVEELLVKEYPSLQLVYAEGVHDALLLVLNGQADAYVGDAASASFAIKQAGLLNLDFSGPTPYQSQSSIAVSKRHPELFSIMEKALASIPQSERDAIVNHWMGLKIEQGLNNDEVLKYAIAAALLLLLFAYWIHRLRMEVKARQQSESRLASLYTNMTLGFVLNEAIFDAEGKMVDARFLDVNPAFEQMTGVRRGYWIGKCAREVFPSLEDNWIKIFVGVVTTGKPCHFEQYAAPLGRWFYTYCYTPTPGQFVVLAQDITERKLIEEKLRLTARVFDTTLESVAVTDAAGNLIDVNTAFSLITGYSREEVLGKNPRMLKSGRHGTHFYESMWQAIASRGHWSGEIWNRRKSGENFPLWLTISALTDENGQPTHYVGIASDISLLKQHEKQLEHIAHYDALTGIPNRVLLADRMRQAIAQTKRNKKLLGVCYIDLDGFKPINDGFGHEAGDRVLIEIARRITHALRSGDTVARLGGDEFVILLLELEGADECNSTVKRLLDAIGKPLSVVGESFTVTASIGVTLFPQDNQDPDTLLRHADQAMYIAKQSGRNCFHIYDTERDRRAHALSESLAMIRHGLLTGEFELFYQPKIHMGSGKLVGVESLIRWRHPTRGLLPPADFLPCLEKSELENTLGDWVIDAALAQLDRWQQEGHLVEASVNIAAGHLQSDAFIDNLRDKLVRYPNLPPGALQIEILETAALADIPKVAGIIEICADMGVSFALDDFGTGYSSLAYLRRLPAETLKIDQSFVRDMLTDSADRAIVQGIIALAHAFGRKIVAEGVETEAHCHVLIEMGCDIGQGYGIARPMPANDFAHWRQNRL